MMYHFNLEEKTSHHDPAVERRGTGGHQGHNGKENEGKSVIINLQTLNLTLLITNNTNLRIARIFYEKAFEEFGLFVPFVIIKGPASEKVR
jgi:hypothetical protein